MNGPVEVSYRLELGGRRQIGTDARPQSTELPGAPIPRIARLMALAIRLDGLIREGHIRDYAEAARLGRVTRARITQIVKLLYLAPDIQEQLLFLAPTQGVKERNLRPIVRRVDWDEQRREFQRLAERLVGGGRITA